MGFLLSLPFKIAGLILNLIVGLARMALGIAAILLNPVVFVVIVGVIIFMSMG